METLRHVSDDDDDDDHDVPVLLRDSCVCCSAVLQGELKGTNWTHKLPLYAEATAKKKGNLSRVHMQFSESSQPIEPGDVGTNNDGMYGQQKWGIHNDNPYEVLPKVNAPNKLFF